MAAPLTELPAIDPALVEGFALPLLRFLVDRCHGGQRRPVLALNGPVGAGKSSLARLLERLAPGLGLSLAVASIDDLYLPWPQRRSALLGNPFGVGRVPPGSHDLLLLQGALANWRRSGRLRLPRFDKTMAAGQGDRHGWRGQQAEALLLEGWLMGCRPLGAEALADLPTQDLAELTPLERQWLPYWDRQLAAYRPIWRACDGLALLRPLHWGLPRRWRFQAEAQQRRAGGGWLAAAELDRLVRASICSLPPALYQDPLLPPGWEASVSGRQDWDIGALAGVDQSRLNLAGLDLPLVAVAVLDGRRRCRSVGVPAQDSASSPSSAIG